MRQKKQSRHLAKVRRDARSKLASDDIPGSISDALAKDDTPDIPEINDTHDEFTGIASDALSEDVLQTFTGITSDALPRDAPQAYSGITSDALPRDAPQAFTGITSDALPRGAPQAYTGITSDALPRDVSQAFTGITSDALSKEVSCVSEDIPDGFAGTSFDARIYASLTRKRKHEPFLVQYVSPKRNLPRLSKTRTPRSRRDILNPKPRPPAPEGRRFFSIGAVEAAMNLAARHSSKCTAPNFYISEETKKGLASTFEVRCTWCPQRFDITNDDSTASLPVNEGGVWAANATGIGYTSMKHSLAALDVPFMSAPTFIAKENKFSQALQLAAKDEYLENGKMELEKAIALDQFIVIEGKKVGWTSIIADGQWSKRSYKQAGTANSGSACIIGYLTGKPLFVGVRNKFCLICQKNSKEETKQEHECFRNWKLPSSAMEADIIAEGFKESIATHNLIYKFLIGDGDSSVHDEVVLTYYKPELGNIIVKKLECKNHAVRRMNMKLLALLSQTIFPVAHRKTLEGRIARIGKCCAYIIQHNYDNKPNSSGSTLKSDLMNVLHHVFGDHSKCKAMNCAAGISVVPESMKKHSRSSSTEPRSAAPSIIGQIVDTPLWVAMSKILERLALYSDSLIEAVTTNAAESFQSHMNKFLQGRRVHISARGGYLRKTACAVFSYQHGQCWYRAAFKRINTNKKYPLLWDKLNQEACRIRSRPRKPPTTRKMIFQKYSKPPYLSRTFIANEGGDEFYGECSRKPDVSVDELKALILTLKEKLSVSSLTEQLRIHEKTKGQWDNPAYLIEHENRITASSCGRIYSLKDSTPNVGVLDALLHNSFSGNDATTWGKIHERAAISCYERETNTIVSQSGIFIHLDHGMLAASPDGLIGSDGILEVKCPFVERHLYPSDLSKRKANKFLIRHGDNFDLLPSSHYYYQVTLQLQATGCQWCDFCIWTQGPLDPEGLMPLHPQGFLLKIRVLKEETDGLWKKMLPKLLRFWEQDMAPELVDSRRCRRLGYRQPEYRNNAIKQRERENEEKAKRAVAIDESITAVLHSIQ